MDAWTRIEKQASETRQEKMMEKWIGNARFYGAQGCGWILHNNKLCFSSCFLSSCRVV